jgi:hypothetical protein
VTDTDEQPTRAADRTTEPTATPGDAGDLAARLDAVERALTGTDAAVADLGDAAAVEERLDGLEARLAALDERLDDLDAATRALRGYAGGVSAVDEAVERRADVALAKAEALERRLDPEPGLQVERLTDGTADVDADEPSVTGDEREAVADDAEADERSLAERLRDAL